MQSNFARPALLVFATVLASAGYFWQTRDWNTASRLMLTYAIIDRSTVSISHLDLQTGDKAWFQGDYYSDKLPGYPLLAAGPYLAVKKSLGLPSHPLDLEAFPYWAADYWTTLFTSGLLTAATSALLVIAAGAMGCGPRRAGLIGLAYGLATPAYIYATLAYGHQASAFALFCSFYLLWSRGKSRDDARVFAAGALASYAAVIELQVGPVSAILGLYLLAQCLSGQRTLDKLGVFFVGALIPAVLLLSYNQLAFGSPWEFGYFHHATREFAQVHNQKNPLGLTWPVWNKLGPLLLGRYRGLLFYAPVLWLAVPGWIVLFARKRIDIGLVSLLVVIAILLVNLSYPEWTGGWSTGPRLLVPLLPFAMLPVASLLCGSSRLAHSATFLAAVLAVAGGIEMLLFQAVGGRIPQWVADPLGEVVWPLWTADAPLPEWRYHIRFSCNLASLILERAHVHLDPLWQPSQFVPLVALQGAAILCIWRCRAQGRSTSTTTSEM